MLSAVSATPVYMTTIYKKNFIFRRRDARANNL